MQHGFGRAVRRRRSEKCSPSGLRGPQPRRAEARNSLRVRLRPPQVATRKHFVNSRASALPAAEAIAADPEIVSPRRFFAPPFDVKRWHNRLRCQSSLPFGGMTDYLVYKTGVTPATRRVARAAASALRRPAVVRECSRRGPRRLRPETFPINVTCGSLSRAVRRRPLAADCNSL